MDRTSSSTKAYPAGYLVIVFWLGVMVAGCTVLVDLSKEGEVLPPAASSALELTGSPSDTIRIRLLKLDSGVAIRRSDIRARFEDPESTFESTVNVQTQTINRFSHQVLHAFLPVPDIPDRDAGVLTGTLYGRVEFDRGLPAQLEIPFQLKVAPMGQIATSGMRTPALSVAEANRLGVVLFFGSQASTILLILWLVNRGLLPA